jgi:uncharacterized protein (TIRG00374 family)
MRRTLVGFVVGVLLLVAVATLLDLGAVAAVVVRADGELFVLGLGLGLAGVTTLGEALRRVRSAVGPEADADGGRFYAAFWSAHFLRLLIPVGSSGAPAITAYMLYGAFGGEYEEELAVTSAAELLSYVASATLVLTGLALALAGGTTVRYANLLVTAGVGMLGVAVLLLGGLLYRPEAADRVVYPAARAVDATLGRLSTRVHEAVASDAVERRLAGFHDTAALLRASPRALVAGVALSLLAWVCLSLPLYVGGLALGEQFPIALVLVAVPVSGFLYVLPVSGGLGGVEVVIASLLVAGAGVTVPVAAAATLLYRLATFWAPLAVGGVVSVAHPVVAPEEAL